MFSKFESVNVVNAGPRCNCPLHKKWIWSFSENGCTGCSYFNGYDSFDWGKKIKCSLSDTGTVDAPFRAFCPMQEKWISIKGKSNSCTFCPYVSKLRYNNKKLEVECKWGGKDPVYNFDGESFVSRREHDPVEIEESVSDYKFDAEGIDLL